MGLTEDLKKERWLALACLVVLGCVGWSAIILLDEYVKYDADKGNWDTAVSLDLPVEVTRVILPGSTVFTYLPRGDEKAVFYVYDEDHVQAQSYNVSFHDLADSRGFFSDNPWPTVELKVIRMNGTEEKYKLMTRDGGI